MNAEVLSRMQQRAAAHRARAEVRAWEYRQRKYAKGVWFRLRRVLVDASHAYAIDESQAAGLVEAGFSVLPVGRELHPERTLFMLNTEQAGKLQNRRQVPLQLGPVLEEAYLVLVAMEAPVPNS